MGKPEHVLHARREYQSVMRDDLVRLVEQNVLRKVTAFMSGNHIEPDLAAEVFILAPQDDLEAVADTDGH